MLNLFKSGLWARIVGVGAVAISFAGCDGDFNEVVVPTQVSKVLQAVPEESLGSAIAGVINDAQYSKESADDFKRFTYLVCEAESLRHKMVVYNGGDPNETYITNVNGSPVIQTGANNIAEMKLVVEVNDPQLVDSVTVNGTQYTGADFEFGTPELPLDQGAFDAANRLPGHYLVISMGPLNAGDFMSIDIAVEGQSGVVVHFDAFGQAPCGRVLVNAAWHGSSFCIEREREDITVEPACDSDPLVSRRWRITNPNSVDVGTTWSIDETGQSGSFVATPGVSYIEVPAESLGARTLTVVYDGDKEITSLNAGQRCSTDFIDLDLGYKCPRDLNTTRSWVIYNSNPFNVPAHISVGSYSADIVVAPGENHITTPVQSGTNTLTITYEGQRSASITANVSECFEHPGFEIGTKCTDEPGTSRIWNIHYIGAPISVQWELSDGSASGTISFDGQNPTELQVPVTSGGQKTLILRMFGEVVAMSDNSGEECAVLPPSIQVDGLCVKRSGIHRYRLVSFEQTDVQVQYEVLETGAMGTLTLSPGENFFETPAPIQGGSTLLVTFNGETIMTVVNSGRACGNVPEVCITARSKCTADPSVTRRWGIAMWGSNQTIELNWQYSDGSQSGTVQVPPGDMTYFETPAGGVTGNITIEFFHFGRAVGSASNAGEVCKTGCTLNTGYWKTQYNQLPAPYTRNDTFCAADGRTWIQILGASSNGDAWLALAKQYIAARYNQAAGASSTTAVTAALNSAQNLLSQYCGQFISNTSSTGQQMSSSTTVLDSYNNGVIGPGKCRNGGC